MATTSTTAIGTSSLDVNSIVTQLMTVERQPIAKLNAREASYQAKLSAYGSVKGSVAGFQSALQGLNSPSKFNTLKATPSDATVLSASATSIAVAGTYSLDVTSLAQAQKLVAGGTTSSTATIGAAATTTVTFDFGTIAGNTFDATTGKYGATLSATTTNTSTTVTVASTANLAAGATISGAGIPVGATIVSITNATDFVISAAATATGAGVALQAGATFTSNGNGTKSITVDSSNNSLQGIRDAINAAKIGITATIVNDGSATPYRLTLSSDNNGVSNSIKITTSGDASIGTLLAHDPAGLPAAQHLNQTVTAQNAVFKVNGIPISKTSNTVTDVIQGVTFTLTKAAATANLTVARDNAGVSSSISSFVKAYSDLATTLKNVSAYDAATKKAATLQGDSTVRTLQSQLSSMLSTPVVGTSGTLTMLADIGITAQKDGTLAINQTKLDSALDSNFSDVASLFTSVGKATDSLSSFYNATTATKAGSYAVNVTQIATQGSITGNLSVPATGNIIASATAINVTLDGVTASVTLTAGTYTNTQLATTIQSAINGTSAFSSAGSSVAATINGSGFMNITSNQYGSTSAVSMASVTGTAVSAFMGTVTSGTPGVNVAGSIGGASASGSGQVLSAVNGDQQGLSMIINGGALGARGTLNYSQGYASILNKWSTAMLASDGPLISVSNGISSTIKDLGKRRSDLETRLIGVEKRYRAQFTSLDAMLTSMSQTSTYLTQQLAKL